jgi:hypothetical protein
MTVPARLSRAPRTSGNPGHSRAGSRACRMFMHCHPVLNIRFCRGQGRAPGAQRALGRRARLVLIKKTFQRRNVSLVFRTLHRPLEIQHMTQADKRQAVYNIRLGDLLGDRRLSRPS